MIEKLLAGLVLLACVVLAVRLVLPAARRGRFDAALGRLWRGLRERTRAALRRTPQRRRDDRAGAARERQAEERARQEADAAIRRARQGSWQGNVFRPDSFKGDAGEATPPDLDRRNLH